MKELSVRVVFSGEGLNARRWVIGFLARSRLHVSTSTTREHKRASQRSVPLPSRFPRRVNVRRRGVLGACLRALTRLEEGADGDDEDPERHHRCREESGEDSREKEDDNIDNSHTACYPNGAVVQGALYAPRSNVVLLKIQTPSCGEEVKNRKAWLLKFV